MRQKIKPATVLFITGGVIYPFLVYFLSGHISSLVWVMTAFCLLGVRFYLARRIDNSPFLLASIILMMVIIGVCAIINPNLAMKIYPVAISSGMAFLFGVSLLSPPSFVERIARIREKDLPEKGVRYTRKVTILWTFVLIINAAISAVTALYFDLEIWTLWNGFLSYCLMGTVFAVEYAVRQKVQGR